MDGTSICEAMVKACMIPGSQSAVPTDPADGCYRVMTGEQQNASDGWHNHPARPEQECATVADSSGGFIRNPWPALERWWRRRRRIFWMPTSQNRPEITLEILTADNPMPALVDWAFEFREWNRARRFWQVAILLASLSLAGFVANTLLERQLAGITVPNTAIGAPTD